MIDKTKEQRDGSLTFEVLPYPKPDKVNDDLKVVDSVRDCVFP